VFAELFRPGGAEINFRRCAHYGLSGEVSVERVEAAVAACGETLLGVELRRDTSSRALILNPERSERLTLNESDRLCLLIRDTEA
jgi:hypothetical protein